MAYGVEGDPFDPSLHEAVQHEGDGTNPVIGTVMRQGYRLGDGPVLRHAMVGVVDAVGDADTADGSAAGQRHERQRELRIRSVARCERQARR